MALELNRDTWIISDTHFGHKNIIKYCSRPMNHNELMIYNWLDLIGEEAQVLHLGDLAIWYGETEKDWLKASSELTGDKYMLRGNHDKLKDVQYRALGYKIIPEFIAIINSTRVLFSHCPDIFRTDEWDINVHGHVHNNQPFRSGSHSYNVSVEVMGYKPVRLGEILDAT